MFTQIRWSAWLLLAACAAPASVPPAAPAPAQDVMHRYFLVLLRRGPAWTQESTPESEKLGEGHMANIHKMAAAGKLVVAGPFEAPEGDRAALAGVFVFDVATKEEVQALVAGDPAVAAGRFSVEILPWWSKEGLGYVAR
jgi:uncharacterized protein YciI